MLCIYCGNETHVTNSRAQKRRNTIWRRRSCSSCNAIFTSTEGVDLEKSIAVNKHDHLKPFLRDKLFASVYDSLKHRKTALSDATALTDTIILQVLANIRNGTVLQEDIASISCKVLMRFDKTAATFYSAYHPTQPRSES